MKPIPRINFCKPLMAIHIPSVKNQEEYILRKSELSYEGVLDQIRKQFVQTPNAGLLDLMGNGFVLLSDCEWPTNDMFFMTWGSRGIVPIYVGEGQKLSFGTLPEVADLIIPKSDIDYLYDTSRNSVVKPKKPITTYLVHAKATNRVKIGKTTNFNQRIKTLTTSIGEELEVLALIEEDKESELHKTFKAYRLKGEWFEYSKELQEYVASLTSLKIA